MAIVEEYHIGAGKACICDNYFVKTNEDIAQILKDISDIIFEAEMNEKNNFDKKPNTGNDIL